MSLSPFDPRAMERWDPFRDRWPLRDVMDRMMSGFPWAQGTEGDRWNPALDVSETDDEYRVTVSLPGMRPDDVKVSVQNNTVTIEGEHQEERKEGERGLYTERRYGRFSRSFSLPMGVNADKARAEFEHGELHLTLPKSEAARPKQITIQPTAEGHKIESSRREEVQIS